MERKSYWVKSTDKKSATMYYINIVFYSSFQETMKPKIPPMIISTSKINTPVREKEKKKGSLVRTIRLPGASQLQASAHNFSSPVHSHSSHHSAHHSSSSSSSRSHSHHHKTPSSTHKKKKKKRKRYTSDSDDDDDSDYDPYG